MRYGRGVLDAEVRPLAGIVQGVPAAVPLFDSETCFYRGSILGHEVIHIPLARVIIVDAQNPDRVLVR